MKKLPFLVLLICSVSIFAQDISEIHKSIREFVNNRNYKAAISELQNLRRSDEKRFELNNYDYLLARLAEKQGDFGTALANYQSVVDRNSVLAEYALWHLSEISKSSGNLFLERLYLRELLTVSPQSLIKDAANSRLARSSFESKDFDSAISSLLGNVNFNESGLDQKASANNSSADDIFGDLTGSDPKTRENLVWLGNSYLQSGNGGKAQTVFEKLVNEIPKDGQPDDFALEGARGLDKLGVGTENFGKIAPELSDSEHLKRANIYQFNREFENARIHFQALLDRFSKNPNIPNAMFQIGRGYMQERNFSSAASWFERIQEEYPESGAAANALYQTASAYTRVNKTEDAVARYQKFIDLNRDGANVERAYLNIVDIMRDTGEVADALNRTSKTREEFRGKMPEAVAIFAQARIHLSQKDWQSALVDLDSLRFLGNLGGADVPGGTNLEEITFLKGFVLERLNRFGEAIEIYLSIPDGRKSYYGWRATERLKSLYQNENTFSYVEAKIRKLNAASAAVTSEEKRKIFQSVFRLTGEKTALDTIRSIYAELPEYNTIPDPKLLEFGRMEVLRGERGAAENLHKIIADELLFLGLYDEGTPELEFGWKSEQIAITEDHRFTLAVYYKRGNMANRSVAYIEPLWRKIPDDYQIELIPREQLKLLYPAPYADSLLKFAPPRSLDPRFVLSIMRQEARFQANIKSSAAARGLMQFIPSTSNQIAIELEREDFNQDELHYPPTAVLFGSQYLSNLFRQFPGQPQAVAASYNGGEDNMVRWYARSSSSDPDLYVPEILYAQSKDYVFKVMQNYRIYRMIYDENLMPAD